MEAVAKNAATIELLKERIRKLQAAPRRYLAALRTGVGPLDALLPSGGIPLGQAVELWGDAAAGRTSLALRAVAAAHRENRIAAWVDGPSELYPPSAAALGVDLGRLLIVRPKAPRQLVWAAQQLARSGAFACVVVDLTHTGVRPSLAEGRKLQEAAAQGGGALLLLTPLEAPSDGMVRLRVAADGLEGFAVEVLRSRGGGVGARARVDWEALFPDGAPRYRYAAPGEGLGAYPLEPDGHGPSEAPYNRGRSWQQRNGYGGCGFYGSYGPRLGRDGRMPPLEADLGA